VPFRPLDAGLVKKSRSGSGMNILDHISKSLETIFWVKILKFFDTCGFGSGNLFDPRSGIRDGKIRIWDKHPGSATLVIGGCTLQTDKQLKGPKLCTVSPGQTIFSFF
jgi:hypothetical protein